jgi:hypothetical protein
MLQWTEREIPVSEINAEELHWKLLLGMPKKSGDNFNLDLWTWVVSLGMTVW